jgi:hypothetical protein
MNKAQASLKIRSSHSDTVEISWFAPLCDDDFALLGAKDPALKNT